MPRNPTLTWEKLDDLFYRTLEGYELEWGSDVDIAEHLVAMAPYGGAIALARDFSKLRRYDGVGSLKNGPQTIQVFSGSGRLIHNLPHDGARIRGLGWSDSEELIAISESGTARCYFDFEGGFTEFTLGQLAEREGVIECQFSDRGFVALLSNNAFIAVSNYNEPRIRVLYEPPQALPSSPVAAGISGWTLMPMPYESSSSTLEVLAAMTDNSVLHLVLNESAEANQPVFSSGLKITDQIIKLAVSPNLAFVALYTRSHTISILSFDLSRQFLTVPLAESAGQLPDQVIWCGNDAVAVVYGDEILFIGLLGGSFTLYYNSNAEVIQEIDGMRILTNEKHDYFSQVPNSVTEIFRLGSTAPAAILRDCVDEVELSSPRADENLSLIKNELPEAVDACIEAAGLEFDIYWQKKLLKAASFGKSAIELYAPDNFIQMCDYLRVLNIVRDSKIGILISYHQLLKITPEKLVNRLLLRSMFGIAFEISSFLKLPVEQVFVRWACARIIGALPEQSDELLGRIIVEKLNQLSGHTNSGGVSFATIARTAYREGRFQLATDFAKLESRPEKSVPLLLEMQQDSLALEEACKAHNDNLIFYVIIMLKRKLPLAHFFRIINHFPLAGACLIRLAGSRDALFSFDDDILYDYFYQDDRRLETAQLMQKQSIIEKNYAQQKELLRQALKIYTEMKSTRDFEKKAFEEEFKLLQLQEQLEGEFDKPFVNLSVSETIARLLEMAQNQKAQKVKDQFQMSDQRYWWIRLRVLVERRDWDRLIRLAKGTKKSPIGYEPFYKVALKAGNTRAASQFVELCTGLNDEKKCAMYIEADDVPSAIRVAASSKNLALLTDLRSKVAPAYHADIDLAIDDSSR